MYHITETPTFISGDSMVVFDPCGTLDKAASSGGHRFSLKEMMAQAPLRKAFDIGLARFPDGDAVESIEFTAFRLPLRTKE